MAEKKNRIDPDAEARSLLSAQLERAKKEKLPDLLTLILFVGLIAAFAISFWVIPDRDFSEEENRVLTKFPEVSSESVFSGKFTADFADYMADQFPLRDQLVGVKAAAELALGKRENNVIFVISDTLAERFDSVNADNLTRNVEAIEAFVSACRDRGVSAQFAVFGRAMDVRDIPIYGDGAEKRAWAMLDGVDHIDMREAVDSHTGEYVYYRTDHHHTGLGAYYAYAHLASALGYEANPIEHYRREIVSDSFLGTAYSKAGTKWIAPDEIEFFRWDGDGDITVTVDDTGEVHSGMYFTEYLDKKDKYSAFLGGNYARVDVTGPGEKPKLLLVKDSFAHSLAPFLAEHFDVTMIDPRYYKKPLIRLVEEEGIDAVLVCCNMDTLSSAAPFAILKSGLK